MEPDVARLLVEHERVFNDAVRRGDFDALVMLFADDAVLVFEGLPVGPFAGRAAVAAAYAAQPPTDTLTVLGRATLPDGTIRETFAWDADSGRPSGEMDLVVRDGHIARLIVRFRETMEPSSGPPSGQALNARPG